ncbi:5-oxoprolinase subunit PxpB [Actinacidiphila oryziradicis]|uniref:5-oxoprolinase subunit PxpB n=1 Tax=Actinacidiphila oryziradicis TaxID=2571141 RepID=A0A4U0RXV1_9ACTN|nr:5-oxoprolinase subunit PxpB [Actinacidiphila oryziradicis]
MTSASTADVVKILPVGDRALLLELDGPAEVHALHVEIERRRRDGRLPAVEEVIPAARTILIDGLADPMRFAREVTDWQVPPAEVDDRGLVEVPTIYDGADLEQVARHWHMTTREVIATHASVEHRVAFCGFAPGFAYITGLPPECTVPRRANPRTAVPAGSVALAGEFTGIYPRPSPGGWQLIGRAEVSLWDPNRDPATLLSPGTRVRFVELGS